MRFTFIFCAMILSAVSLSACGTSEVEKSTGRVTEGQALMDLKNARNAGAINHDEYADQKEEILDRYEN